MGQELIKSNIERLRELKSDHPDPENRPERVQTRIYQAQEALILEIDDPVFRREPRRLEEVRSVLDERETQELDTAGRYVVAARNEGLDPVEAYRQGWRPGQGESRDETKNKKEKKSKKKTKDTGSDKSQDQDKSESEDKNQSWGYDGMSR